MNCKQYQDGLQLNDADKKTQISIIELLQSGTAMKCPKCNVRIRMAKSMNYKILQFRYSLQFTDNNK